MSKKEDFHERLLRFIGHLGLKPTSFEAAMGFSNGSIGKLLNEKRALGSDRLETIVSKYPHLNAAWLLTGKGSMLKESEVSVVKEPVVEYQKPATMTIDKKGNRMIPIVDIKAAAGSGYINEEVLSTSEFIQLPSNLTKKGGNYLCIRIKGPSMAPTFQDSGYIIIRLLERGDWINIVNDYAYVVCDNQNQVYFKRLRNRLANGFIVLTSDNPEKATFPNFNLREDEIMSVWYVEWYFTAKMPNVTNQYYSQQQQMRDDIDDIKQQLAELTRVERKLK